MAIYSTRAIIIGRHNFGEADRIIVLLTPERGVVRGVAKGVRRIKSRMAGHLELFSESELMLAEGKGMDTITSARLQRHLNVSDDYDQMRLAYLFAEMVNRLGSEHDEQHGGLFELLHEAFEALAATGPSVAVELWMKLRLLDTLGYRPELGGCTVCSVADGTRSYLFNVELGGIVDRGCSTPGNHPLELDHIKLWRLMLEHSFPTVSKVPAMEQLAVATMPICNDFYDYTFGRRFKSSEALT